MASERPPEAPDLGYDTEEFLKQVVEAGVDPRAFPYDRPARGFVVPAWPLAEPVDDRRHRMPDAYVKRSKKEPRPEDDQDSDTVFHERVDQDPDSRRETRRRRNRSRKELEAEQEREAEDYNRLLTDEFHTNEAQESLKAMASDARLSMRAVAAYLERGDLLPREDDPEELKRSFEVLNKSLARRDAHQRGRLLRNYGEIARGLRGDPAQLSDEELLKQTWGVVKMAAGELARATYGTVMPRKTGAFLRELATNVMPDSEEDKAKNAILAQTGLVDSDAEEAVNRLVNRGSLLGRVGETVAFAMSVLTGATPADTPVAMWRADAAIAAERDEAFGIKSNLFSLGRHVIGENSMLAGAFKIMDEGPTMHTVMSYEGILMYMGSMWMMGVIAGGVGGGLHGAKLANLARYRNKRLRWNTILNTASRGSAKLGNRLVWIPPAIYLAHAIKPRMDSQLLNEAWLGACFALMFGRRGKRLNITLGITAIQALPRAVRSVFPYSTRNSSQEYDAHMAREAVPTASPY